ncbi:MAG: hypothetical protein L0214_09340 [candidate division NC10 bacterium]|nr:hypothetical protein [candidate division NC10 bacterium]
MGMVHRLGWGVWGGLALFLLMLGGAVSACGPDPARVNWAASGVQVTGLELALGGDGHKFVVGEYALEGQEWSAGRAREFRDRVLLTLQLRGPERQVWGYATRTYADGGTFTFRLSGMLQPVWRDPEVMVMTGRTHSVWSDGLVSHRPMVWIELRLDPQTGRISAKAP